MQGRILPAQLLRLTDEQGLSSHRIIHALRAGQIQNPDLPVSFAVLQHSAQLLRLSFRTAMKRQIIGKVHDLFKFIGQKQIAKLRLLFRKRLMYNSLFPVRPHLCIPEDQRLTLRKSLFHKSFRNISRIANQ